MIRNFFVTAVRNLFKRLLPFVIAIPVTYCLLQQGLRNYTFKTSMTPWFFLLPAVLILFIAVITVSTQTMKAASASPVKNLRTE